VCKCDPSWPVAWCRATSALRPTDSSARVIAVISGSIGKRCGIYDSRQHSDGARIQHATLVKRSGHSAESKSSSRSARSSAGSTAGKPRHRCSRRTACNGERGRGRSSAIGRPCRVTVNASPPVTRSRISPQWLRRSCTDTSAITQIVLPARKPWRSSSGRTSRQKRSGSGGAALVPPSPDRQIRSRPYVCCRDTRRTTWQAFSKVSTGTLAPVGLDARRRSRYGGSYER
jgi:hypothetical protein